MKLSLKLIGTEEKKSCFILPIEMALQRRYLLKQFGSEAQEMTLKAEVPSRRLLEGQLLH
jgi:hypothetical protein